MTDAERIAALEAEVEKYRSLYHDLLLCVANKIPGESRHETAKRIIVQHENVTGDSPSQEGGER